MHVALYSSIKGQGLSYPLNTYSQLPITLLSADHGPLVALLVSIVTKLNLRQAEIIHMAVEVGYLCGGKGSITFSNKWFYVEIC